MSGDRCPLDEARRVLTICAICNYCNGFCAMFRAAHRRRTFSDAEVTYLAYLCHDCRNCRPACQYLPPHPLAVDVPDTMAAVRRVTAHDRPWLALLPVFLIPALAIALIPAEVLFSRHAGPGAFYAVMPWAVLVSLAAIPLIASLIALTIRTRRLWRATGGGRLSLSAAFTALHDLAVLRNLEGGGIPCDAGPARRILHQATVTGLVLCFAATTIATVYHYLLDQPAPYRLLSAPTLLGSAGGIALAIGTAGFIWLALGRRRAAPVVPADLTLSTMLLGTALSGLVLLALRETPAMGFLLALHLGFVCGVFASLASGRFVHVPYRALALMRAAQEERKTTKGDVTRVGGLR